MTEARKRKHPAEFPKALSLLAKWMEKEDLDTAKLARRLDIAWDTMKRIQDGESEPSASVLFALHDLSGIPIESWRV